MDLAKSSLDLANNEVEDAAGDLSEAGGNRRGRIAQLKQSHEDAEHGKDAEIRFPQATPSQFGLVHVFQEWNALRQKLQLLSKAKADAAAAAAAAEETHKARAKEGDAEKINKPDGAEEASAGRK